LAETPAAQATEQPAASTPAAESVPQDAKERRARELKAKWGIEVVALRLTAAGHMLKVGRLRQRSNEPKVGRHYFMLFANPGHYFKAGDQVTIEIGEFRAENLTVEG
jgi:hypothetical protein